MGDFFYAKPPIIEGMNGCKQAQKGDTRDEMSTMPDRN